MHLDFWHGLALFVCFSTWPLVNARVWTEVLDASRDEALFGSGSASLIAIVAFTYLVGAQAPIPMWWH